MISFARKNRSPFRQDPIIASLARLSDDDLQTMETDDLLEVIRLSRGLKSLQNVPASLRECDREVLLDFAFVARDMCRDETQAGSPRAKTQPWFAAG
jgi:hypothetical protein